MVRRQFGLPALVGLLLSGCNACTPPETRNPPENQPNVVWCPGSPGCLPEGEDDIQAGVGRRSIVPTHYEIANVNYLKGSTGCDPLNEQRFGARRCGELFDTLRDCGRDGVCPGDPGYTAPDADGTERDGKSDWYFDCGLDRICPGNVPEANDPVTADIDEANDGVDNDGDGAVDDGAYPGPDPGEGDGVFTGAWIAGFGNNRPALGFYDDVDVRCIALRTKETTSVVCSLDVVGFFYDEVERARERFKARHANLDLDYLAVSSTHTHENVDTMGQWGRADPIPITPGILKYESFDGSFTYNHNSFIVDQIVEAAAEAVQSLKPARITLKQVETGAEGLLEDLMDPQIIDDTMTLAEARSRDGDQPIFTAVHWSNHPEIMGTDNNLMSSDYVGVVRRAVERGLPAENGKPALAGRGGTAVYIQGTVGGLLSQLHVDVTGRNGVFYPESERSYARMEAYGQNLAEIALTALADPANARVIERGELTVRAERYFIPVVNRVFIFAFAAGLFDRLVFDENTGEPIDPLVDSLLEREGSARTEVFTIDLADWSMAGVPGELFPEVAMGGYDGTKAFGEPFIDPEYCPPQSACVASTNDPADCPETRPEDGWEDCRCEQCRLCKVPDVSTAPAAPYLKDKMPGGHKMVIGLANDELGYMVPSWLFQISETGPYFCEAKNHYPETNSTGPHAVPRTEAALQKLFDFKP